MSGHKKFNIYNAPLERLMKVLSGIIAAAALMLSTQAFAVDMAAGKALAQKSGCLACHTVDKKVVGPSYKDIAAKYKGNKAAEDMLAAKITKGGSGVWGPVPMPANAKVAPADVKTLVQWVLAQ